MDKIANISKEERAAIFAETAEKVSLTPTAVEKDFWVCWVLKQIFEHSELSKLFVFKGGTSLAKCFGLIERFSEDIDLIIDWSLVTTVDPYKERSNRQQDIFNKATSVATEAYIKNEMFGVISELVKSHCTVKLDSVKPKSLLISYPQENQTNYIKDNIELEIGAMSAMRPSGEYVIQCMSAKELPDVFDQVDINIKSVQAKKTFWDKITILHVEAHRSAERQQPNRYSRHYYDVFKMLNSSVKTEALNDLDLLTEVFEFKHKFYPQGWANYQGAIDGVVKLIPEQYLIDHLKADYVQMHEMIYGDYPDFDLILEEIQGFEALLNAELQK